MRDMTDKIEGVDERQSKLTSLALSTGTVLLLSAYLFFRSLATVTGVLGPFDTEVKQGEYLGVALSFSLTTILLPMAIGATATIASYLLTLRRNDIAELLTSPVSSIRDELSAMTKRMRWVVWIPQAALLAGMVAPLLRFGLWHVYDTYGEQRQYQGQNSYELMLNYPVYIVAVAVSVFSLRLARRLPVAIRALASEQREAIVTELPSAISLPRKPISNLSGVSISATPPRNPQRIVLNPASSAGFRTGIQVL